MELYTKFVGLFDFTVTSDQYKQSNVNNTVGFTRRESDLLEKINTKRNHGVLYGGIGGLVMAYSWGHWYGRMARSYPALIKRPDYKLVMQIALFAIGILEGDYLATSRRYGASSHLGLNFLNNRWYIDKQDAMMAFKPLDRMFTELEISRFDEKMANPTSSRLWPQQNRLWEDFEGMKHRIDNNISPWDDIPTRNAIQDQIGDKQLRPFHLLDHMSE